MRSLLMKGAVVLSVILALCTTVSCANSASDSITTEEPSVSAPLDAEESTVQTTEPPPETDAVPAVRQNTDDSLSAQELIARYNAASGQLKCTGSTQKLTAGEIRLSRDSANGINMLSAGREELRAKAERVANDGSALPQLSASDVADVQTNGNQVTFVLRDITASADTVRQGMGGYVNIIDHPRAVEIIGGVQEYFHIAGADVQLKGVSYELGQGRITACFSDDFTRLQSVRFTAVQRAQAEMFYVVNVYADLTYALTSEYR